MILEIYRVGVIYDVLIYATNFGKILSNFINSFVRTFYFKFLRWHFVSIFKATTFSVDN